MYRCKGYSSCIEKRNFELQPTVFMRQSGINSECRYTLSICVHVQFTDIERVVFIQQLLYCLLWCFTMELGEYRYQSILCNMAQISKKDTRGAISNT